MVGLFIALAGSLALFAFAAAPAFIPFTTAIALYLLGMGFNQSARHRDRAASFRKAGRAGLRAARFPPDGLRSRRRVVRKCSASSAVCFPCRHPHDGFGTCPSCLSPCGNASAQSGGRNMKGIQRGEQTGRRIVVTGMGAVTPLAANVEESWSRLLAGRSGIRRLPNHVVRDLPT